MSEAGNEPAAPANWRECAFVAVQRCAEVLGLSTASVYNLEKDGRLEFRRVAGRTLVAVASMAAVVETAEVWAPASRGAAARRATKGGGKMNCSSQKPPHKPSPLRYPDPGSLLGRVVARANEPGPSPIPSEDLLECAWELHAHGLRESGVPIFHVGFEEYRDSLLRLDLEGERYAELLADCFSDAGPELYDRAREDVAQLYDDPNPGTRFLLDALAHERKEHAKARSTQAERDWQPGPDLTFAKGVVLAAWLDAQFSGPPGAKKSARAAYGEAARRLGINSRVVRNVVETVGPFDRTRWLVLVVLSQELAATEGVPHTGISVAIGDMLLRPCAN